MRASLRVRACACTKQLGPRASASPFGRARLATNLRAVVQDDTTNPPLPRAFAIIREGNGRDGVAEHEAGPRRFGRDCAQHTRTLDPRTTGSFRVNGVTQEARAKAESKLENGDPRTRCACKQTLKMINGWLRDHGRNRAVQHWLGCILLRPANTASHDVSSMIPWSSARDHNHGRQVRVGRTFEVVRGKHGVRDVAGLRE